MAILVLRSPEMEAATIPIDTGVKASARSRQSFFHFTSETIFSGFSMTRIPLLPSSCDGLIDHQRRSRMRILRFIGSSRIEITFGDGARLSAAWEPT